MGDLYMDEEFRVLSLWQPWASLMAVGLKRIETRSWRTSFRGWVIIHAAKKRDEEGRALYERLTVGPGGRYEDLPFGKAVCAVRLVGCVPTETIECNPDLRQKYFDHKQERWFGNYTPGRWAWLTDKSVALEPPVPLRGAQGLRILDIRDRFEVVGPLEGRL